MSEIAKVPSWKDYDHNQFLQHWVKRHVYPGVFDKTHEEFPHDHVPLWFAIRKLHDRVHAGESEFDVPEDHVHLPPVTMTLGQVLAEDIL